jgi:hypothetical protein
MRSINLNRGLSWERSVKCFDCTSQPARPIIISEYVNGQTLYHYPLVVNLSETESLLLTNGYRNLRVATRQHALAHLNALELTSPNRQRIYGLEVSDMRQFVASHFEEDFKRPRGTPGSREALKPRQISCLRHWA